MQGRPVVFAMILLFAASGTIHTLGCNAQDTQTANREEYEFVKDTSRWVMLIEGDTQSIGKLDAEGDFVADWAFLQQKRHQRSSVEPDYVILNAPAQKGVYEFRSGRLIPGDLDDDGNFIPTLGGRIIDFQDYRYSPKAPKIYNLPGKFVHKEKKQEMK
jgi:hypothetical protein